MRHNGWLWGAALGTAVALGGCDAGAEDQGVIEDIEQEPIPGGAVEVPEGGLTPGVTQDPGMQTELTTSVDTATPGSGVPGGPNLPTRGDSAEAPGSQVLPPDTLSSGAVRPPSGGTVPTPQPR